MYTELIYSSSLYHHGIKGQHWGVRRYQNEDGTLTSAGKARYYKTEYKPAKAEYKEAKSELRKARKDYNKKFDKAQKYEDAHNNSANDTDKIAAKRNKKWSEVDKAEARYENAINRHDASKEAYKETSKEVWNNVDKKKLAIKVTTAAAIAATAYVMSNPNRKKAVVEFTKKSEKMAVNSLKETSKKAGKAALEAAFASAGAIAATKVAKKLEAKSDASETEKNVRKIATDAATAAINTAAKTNNNSNNQNNGKSVGKEISEKIGPPSKKSVDKQSSDYQDLFKNQSPETRSTIKSMISAGYDIDQVKAYLYGGIQHSATRGYHAVINFI